MTKNKSVANSSLMFRVIRILNFCSESDTNKKEMCTSVSEICRIVNKIVFVYRNIYLPLASLIT